MREEFFPQEETDKKKKSENVDNRGKGRKFMKQESKDKALLEKNCMSLS